MFALLGGAIGCGILGDVPERLKIVAYEGGTGCLDELSGKFTRYFEGESNSEEWAGVWDCVISSLELFRGWYT